MFFPKETIQRYRFDPEGFADFFLNNFFKDSVITFPINPFSILKKLGIPYLFRSLDKLDGLIFQIQI